MQAHNFLFENLCPDVIQSPEFSLEMGQDMCVLYATSLSGLATALKDQAHQYYCNKLNVLSSKK